jgi:hypothetical protein
MSGDGKSETSVQFNARLHEDIESSTRVIGRPLYHELFGDKVRDWLTMGREHGRCSIAPDESVKSIGSLYDSVFETEWLKYEQARQAWQAGENERKQAREVELQGLRDSVGRLEAAADPTAPESQIAKESRLRDYIHQQLETASSICDLLNPDDIDAAAAKKSNALKRRYADNLARTHFQHSQAMIDRYAAHAPEVLARIARLKNDLRKLDSSTPAYQQKSDELAREQAELEQSAEKRALAEMATLVATAPKPEFETVTHRTRPPSWWRTHLRSYQFFVLFGLVIAFSADQLIMQQLTGPYLGLRTLERLFSDLASHAEDSFWNLRVAYDALGIVLALILGFMPVLLSIPVRWLLEQDNPRYGRWLNTFCGIAVVLFLVAIFGITAVETSGSASDESSESASAGIAWWGFDSGLWRGVAMSAITSVLAIATALLSYQVFFDKASHSFNRHMRKDEPNRLHQAIQESEARMAGTIERAHVERQRLQAAQKLHAQEDAMWVTPGADFKTQLSKAFGEAKKAAEAAYRTGHALGVRARERGFDLSGNDRDTFPLEALVEILIQKKLTEACAPPDQGYDTDQSRTGARPKGPSSSTGTGLPVQ